MSKSFGFKWRKVEILCLSQDSSHSSRITEMSLTFTLLTDFLAFFLDDELLNFSFRFIEKSKTKQPPLLKKNENYNGRMHTWVYHFTLFDQRMINICLHLSWRISDSKYFNKKRNNIRVNSWENVMNKQCRSSSEFPVS